jgi:hypothetical protein
LRRQVALPYRVDLAGGWLDQPFVSRVWPGPVIVASVEGGDGDLGRPHNEERIDADGLGRSRHEEGTLRDGQGRPSYLTPSSLTFDERSGMATSTRETAMKLGGPRLPEGDPLEIARLLFGAENPPGKLPVAGSQDALGICLPGISRLAYAGEYWPKRIESLVDGAMIGWLERLIWLVPVGPRGAEFDVLGDVRVTPDRARRLADAADRAWRSIEARDAEGLGTAVWDSFQAQLSMFPAMTNAQVEAAVAEVRPQVLGCKLTGAGGGGYVLAIAREAPTGAMGVRLRRQWW